MNREAQAMLVAIFVAAHLNAHGKTPSDQRIGELFDLSEKLLVESDRRSRARDLSRGPLPEPVSGDAQAEAGHG